MTDVRMRMRRPGTAGTSRLVGTTQWFPTRAFDATEGLVLPAPLLVQHSAGADVTLSNVPPTDGSFGWCWVAVTEADAVVVDQRAVLVPTGSATVDFEDLVQVDPRRLLPSDSEMGAWQGLRDQILASLGQIPNGARKVNTTTMTFTRDGVDILAPLTLPAGPTGAAATITGVTATTLAAGANATVTAGGTSSARTFAFGIPRGEKGDPGDLNGTVTPAQLPQATETAIGAAERATTAEAVAGTDAVRYVSPAGLRAAADARYRLLDARPTNAVFVGTSQVSLLDGEGQPNTTWTTEMAAAMGWTSRNYAVSGMGYTLGGTTNNFLAQLTRARNDSAYSNTDVGFVFIIDGANDARMGNSVTSAATTAINYAKTNFPNARVIVVPALWSTSPTNDNTVVRKAALAVVVNELRQVAIDLGVEFVEWSWVWHQDNPAFKRAGDDEVHYTTAGNTRTRRMLEMYLRGGSTDTPCVWKPVPTTSKYTASTDGSTLALRARREGNRGFIAGSVTCSSNPVAGDIIGYLPAGLTPSQTVTVVTHCGVAKLNTSIAPNGEIKLWEGATGTRLNISEPYDCF